MSSREQSRKYRKEHPEFYRRELERNREWKRSHRELCRASTHRYKAKNREIVAKKQRDYYKANPEKVKVHRQSKDLELAKECELCPENDKRTESLQKHHPDYRFPSIFVTVCASCHKWADRERNNSS